MLLVTNKADATLSFIDPAAATQIGVVAVGGVTGHEVIASRDGKLAYVPIYGDAGVGQPGTDGHTIAIIDIASRKLITHFDFGHGVRPHCAMIGPRDGLLYVSTELDKAITIIDPLTLELRAQVPTGADESHMFAITRDGKRAYVSNVKPGSVSVVDLETRAVAGIIPISKEAQRIALSADDAWAFTSDQTEARLAVVDTASNTLDGWIALPSLGYGAASTPELLIIALPRAKQVAFIDIAARRVVRTVDVPKYPQEVLIAPDGLTAYVSCDASAQVAAIRIADGSVTLIDAGRGADGLAWAAIS